MHEKEIRWQQPGVITCVAAGDKPDEYKLDWRRLWVQPDLYRKRSAKAIPTVF